MHYRGFVGGGMHRPVWCGLRLHINRSVQYTAGVTCLNCLRAIKSYQRKGA